MLLITKNFVLSERELGQYLERFGVRGTAAESVVSHIACKMEDGLRLVPEDFRPFPKNDQILGFIEDTNFLLDLKYIEVSRV